jgi:hypothetical protein
MDVTKAYASDLLNAGMVTDISVTDFNNDGWMDVILVGDWMPVVVLQNDKKSFLNVSEKLGLLNTEGWWHTIEVADLNKDGMSDFILGNHGLNSFFKSGDRMYVNDFDRNGSVEQLFCTQIDNAYYPIVDKDEFLSQFPSLKKDNLYYKDYSKKSIDQLFSSDVLAASKLYQVELLSSQLLLSNKGKYEINNLPMEAQYSPIYSILVSDFDQDGIEDLICGGNQYFVKPQFGRYDASRGWFFKGNLNGNTYTLKNGQDLNVKGQIRDIEQIIINGTTYILFSKHDDDLEIYKVIR